MRRHRISPPRPRSRFPSATTFAVLIGAIGLAAVWYLVEPPEDIPPTTPAPAVADAGKIGPGPTDGPAPAPVTLAPETGIGKSRAIAGGEAILPAPEYHGPLVRADAPAKPPPPEKPPEDIVLSRVQIDIPGQLRAGKQTVHLSGIRSPQLDKVCRDESGRLWPCGVQARSALRAFIGSRRVSCTPPVPLADGRPDESVASCSLGEQDLAEWLIAQGWAEPGDDAPENFSALADEARERHAGLWQSAPALHAPITPARTMPATIGTPVPVGGEMPTVSPATNPQPPEEEPGDGPPVNLVSPPAR
ncbi:thermonuclease family protein [Segnochrobactraceae bacterium EtOH-i3]